jgi:uncharacterized membrane protein YeaQ/YmgE (transglycosylase-associated protein family)
MSNNKLIGAAIGFMIGMLLGLQMCGRRGDYNDIGFIFSVILGFIGAISGALIAKEDKDK